MSALKSIRVIDLSDISGVYGTKVLSDLGADVVRVEPPSGDPMRDLPPFLDDEPGENRSLLFAFMNTGKRSVHLDLGRPDGQAQLEHLARCADLLYASGSAKAVSDLNVLNLQERLAHLVVTTVTPFGLTGPLSPWEGSDLIAWAMGGLATTLGDADRAPLAPAPAARLAYILGGQYAAISSLAALRRARRRRTGQLVDVSLQESVTSIGGDCGLVTGFLEDLLPRLRSGNRRAMHAPFGHYPTKDGAVAVLATLPWHWERFAQWIFERTGNDAALDPVLRGGPQSRAGDKMDVVTILTEDLTRTYTSQEFFEEGQRRGITVTPVNDPAAVLADPQLHERDFWDEIIVDGRPIKAPGAPYRFSVTPWKTGAVPRPGEHDDQVLAEWEAQPGSLD